MAPTSDGRVIMLETKDADGNVYEKARKVFDVDIVSAAVEALGEDIDQNLLSIIYDYDGNLWFVTGGFRIYPDRLKGVKFDGNMVRFYALNAQGEISHLILNDVTGDLHQYGVITSVEELDLGTMMGISSSYTYDVGGQKLTFGSTNAIYNLK